ncbi:MAG: hypothetical protein N2319_01700 [Candidatus Kapabacteria bacterium]|nr:hypothetical protein [Candidatus Kapabacteria bacterium]
MKKFILLLSILYLAFISNQEIKSCPAGWFPRVITIDYPTCPNISANLCIKCSPLNNSLEIIFISFEGVCNGYDLGAIIDFFEGYIKANYSTFCIGAWKPCSQGTTRIIFRTPLCFYQDYDDNTRFFYCDQSFCVTAYDVCTNSDGSVSSTPAGPPYPQYEGNPYPGCRERSWPQGAGICFHVPNKCN